MDDVSFFRWMIPELKKVKKRVNVEIYAKNKADFAGTNFRVTEFSEKMYSVMEKASSLERNVSDNPESKITMIIDESTSFFVGKIKGQVTGVIIQVPHLVYTIRAFMKLLEEK